ncbi:hypothetical protein T265_04873 [Opisthorchis viverrini]|uniref:Branched-chain-amino-acid aminotransferase n=1 Tax=Opisthorchis viverrini TaxID=6198 RepID=A0A075AG12_OPIVI|nr:hypothetical protein T265_04873 [Opisthorchis viverrini]KER28274.1 hypothetical protein T265_04873 [Opisthorchis viverrini]
MSPVGDYFSSKKKGSRLFADPSYVRTWEGGSGQFKLAANYGPTLALQKLLRERGYDTSLWLYGPDELITEAGTMNIFVFWTNEQGEKELRTPPLSGLILPGVTRQSVLEITRSWNEFKVVEKDITMSMLLNALKENRLHHMFGSGTACVVSPVMELYYKNNRYSIPFTEDPSSIPERILKEYTDIQRAVNGPHPWAHPIDKPR